MKIIASLVLFKHSYDDVKNTLFSLINESSIDKIAIVDNGNYCQWLKSFSHPKVETIHLVKNEGFGAGHNAVFKKYLNMFSHFLVCNPDIVFELGEVDKLFAFSINNNVGLAMPKVIYPDGSLQYGSKLLPTPFQLFIRRFFPAYSTSMNDSYELRLADYTKSFFAPSLSGCFMLISNEALRHIDGFDTRFFLYLEDVDLSRRVCLSNFSVMYFSGAKVVHESQRTSYVKLRFLCYHAVSAVRYFNKWGWFFDKDRKSLNARCLNDLPMQK